MFGITMRDINGVEYGFVIDTVEQVRELARQARQEFGTGVVKATYRNQELSHQDMATLAYGSLAWDPWSLYQVS
jgi:hypothetical protein